MTIDDGLLSLFSFWLPVPKYPVAHLGKKECDVSLGLLGTRGSKQDSSLAQGDSELLGSGSYESLETREAQLGISSRST